jgi:hypothetical protein
MLRQILKTITYKGLLLPTLSWEGDDALVAKAKALSLQIALARSDQHSRLNVAVAHRRQAAKSGAKACADLHALYSESGLSPQHAEQAIFVARLSAEMAEDQTDTAIRDGTLVAWLNDDDPKERRKKFKIVSTSE